MAWFPGAIRKEVTRHRTPMSRYRGHCLHIAVSEGASLFNYFNTPGNPTSHFYVRYSGVVEQYVDTRFIAPAQLEGNPTMIGTETQGGTTNLNTVGWTAAQLETIARLNAWLHETHGIPLVKMPDSLPSSTGIGYHRLGINPWRVDGGELWSKSNAKECPGDLRITQVPGTITRATEIVQGGPVALTQEDADLVAKTLLAKTFEVPGGLTKSVQGCLAEGSFANDALASIQNVGAAVKSQLDAVQAAITGLPVGTGGLTEAQVQAACDAAIRVRFAAVDGA
jgi:hypothetical protein